MTPPVDADAEDYRTLVPRARLFWQVENALGTVALLAAGGALMLGGITPPAWERWIVAVLVAGVLWSLLDAVLLIPLRHRYYRYAVCPDVIVVERGRLWRRRDVYPWARILYCETRQGPLLRWFGLYTVRAATIVDTHAIGPLTEVEARRFEQLLRERPR